MGANPPWLPAALPREEISASRQAGQRQAASGLERGTTQGFSSHQHRSADDNPPQGNTSLQRPHFFRSMGSLNDSYESPTTVHLRELAT